MSASNYNQQHPDDEHDNDNINIPSSSDNNNNQRTSRADYSPVIRNRNNYGNQRDDDENNEEEGGGGQQSSSSQQHQQNTIDNLLDEIVRLEPTEDTRLLNPRRPLAGYDGHTYHHHAHYNDNGNGVNGAGGVESSEYQQNYNDPLSHPGNGRHDDENQHQQQADPNTVQNHNQEHQNEEEQDIGLQIANLTNRLRILFYTLYIPIIPLTVLLFGLLLQLLIKAATSPPCSYPLRFFALASFLLFLYAPNHRTVKRLLFNYSRERDGAIRPRSVRIYDQFFHMICLMYIYLDMVLVQSCREDIVNNVSTCTTTCGDLYSWFQRFDIVLRIFVGVLVLPLVCLPFVYIWIMRRIHSTEALWRLQQGLGRGGADGGRLREEDLLPGGGVKVKDIMENLRSVRLVPSEEDRSKVRVVGLERESWTGERLRDWDGIKDCCICMCEFECDSMVGGEDGSVKDGERSLAMQQGSEGGIVQTRCGHVFHKACIGGWIGGRNWEDSMSLLGSNARARRRCCPLCREDLAVTDGFGADAV